MKTLVIYSSRTGFTKRYAEWIAERTQGDLLELKDAKKKDDTKKKDKKTVSSGSAAGKDKAADKNKGNAKEAAQLPKNKNAFEKELKLLPDTTITVAHNKKSKRLVVTAKTKDGRSYPIK